MVGNKLYFQQQENGKEIQAWNIVNPPKGKFLKNMERNREKKKMFIGG